MATKTIGSVTKRAGTKEFYIKVAEDVVLKKGTYLNLEDEASQLAAIDYAVAQGWLDESKAESRKEAVLAYWNKELPSKDGGTFTRKAINKYNIVLKTKD